LGREAIKKREEVAGVEGKLKGTKKGSNWKESAREGKRKRIGSVSSERTKAGREGKSEAEGHAGGERTSGDQAVPCAMGGIKKTGR